jgi:hypothetical protein
LLSLDIIPYRLSIFRYEKWHLLIKVLPQQWPFPRRAFHHKRVSRFISISLFNPLLIITPSLWLCRQCIKCMIALSDSSNPQVKPLQLHQKQISMMSRLWETLSLKYLQTAETSHWNFQIFYFSIKSVSVPGYLIIYFFLH